MKKVLGLDVGSSSVISCCLSAKPVGLRSYFDAHKRNIEEFTASKAGIRTLLQLHPDVAIMEPSGVHYSEFWYRALTTSGVEVRWVGHVQIRSYRKSHLLPDKNDRADALALACYGLDHLSEPEFFLRFTPEVAQKMRRLYLQLQHLNRLQNPIINCARQYLAHEFPEAAKRQSQRQKPNDVPALWGWLSGERPSPFFDRLWHQSVARDFGLTISDFTRAQARRICDLERHQGVIEQEIEQLMSLAAFAFYHHVFNEFGFGLRTRAVLLSHFYPFEDFLGPSKQPIVDWQESRGGKRTKRDRSLRAFKLRLGMGLIEDSSGKSTAWIPGGSSLCREALWLWVLTRVEPKQDNRRLQTEVGQQLGTYIDKLKANGVPGKVAQLRTAAKATAMLYKKLLAQIYRI